MKDLNFDDILDKIFREEFPYLISGLSKYKTTKIELPNKRKGSYWGGDVVYYDKRTNTFHARGTSYSLDFRGCLGFIDTEFIDNNGYGYSFDPLFGHKHINQDLLVEFINIIKNYVDIRNRHMLLLSGTNYKFNTHSFLYFQDPFENVLTIYNGKEIVFSELLSEYKGQDKQSLIKNSGYKDLIDSLQNSFELIGDEYNNLYKRVKDLTLTYKLIKDL